MTKQEYAEYEDTLQTWWQDYSKGYGQGRLEDCIACPEDDDPHFSWSECDICLRPLGGDRYPAHTIDKNGDVIHWSICPDCLYYLEYGRLDDITMLDMEE